MKRILVICALLATGCARREKKIAVGQLPELQRPEMYTSERIDATVVDATNGKPIAGAAIVAVWRKVELFSERWDGMYRIEQTETDPEGHFTLPRWGPATLSYDDYLDVRDPEIWVLKDGYLLGYFDNSGALDSGRFHADQLPKTVRKPPPNQMLDHRRRAYSRPALASSIWNGKALKLTRSASDEETARSLAVADPIERYEPSRTRLPRFTSEWLSDWQTLPPQLRARACCPRAITDSVTADDRSHLGLR